MNFSIIKNQTVNKINLEKLNKSYQWLSRQLFKRNIKNLEDIFYADWAEDRGIFILQYEEKSSLKKGFNNLNFETLNYWLILFYYSAGIASKIT
ncbi:YetF domain-containing protein [Staphylococcus saprophyticus]|uniref:YetF domain-containing protein n=1 Tax=Staphylococcus saprophyticus TaxID=29385 RepID=UPI003BFA753B